MKFSVKEVYEWVKDHQCAEFSGAEVTYYVHIDNRGNFVPDIGDAMETVSKSADASEWAEDDSPERFYEEFESLDNQKFAEIIAEITEELNKATEYWYAVLANDEDNDWGEGSFDKEEAIQKCKSWREDTYPNAHIAIIDNDDMFDPVCVGEIRDFDE